MKTFKNLIMLIILILTFSSTSFASSIIFYNDNDNSVYVSVSGNELLCSSNGSVSFILPSGNYQVTVYDSERYPSTVTTGVYLNSSEKLVLHYDGSEVHFQEGYTAARIIVPVIEYHPIHAAHHHVHHAPSPRINHPSPVHHSQMYHSTPHHTQHTAHQSANNHSVQKPHSSVNHHGVDNHHHSSSRPMSSRSTPETRR